MSCLNNVCVCPSLHFLCVSVFKYVLRMSGFFIVMSGSVCDWNDLLSVVDVRLILQISCACASKRLVFLCCYFFLLRCPFWSCVVCASLVVARRDQRIDEGGNRNKCLRRCIANIEVFIIFNDFVVCTWFLAQNWKKAENDLNVFDIGWRPRSRTLC